MIVSGVCIKPCTLNPKPYDEVVPMQGACRNDSGSRSHGPTLALIRVPYYK